MRSRIWMGSALGLIASLGVLQGTACSSSDVAVTEPHEAEAGAFEGGVETSASLEDAGPDRDADAAPLPPPPPYDFAVQCAGAACVTSIAARGGSHACAVFQDGSVRCWGSNASGQLGTGSTDAGPMPVLDGKPRVVDGIANATGVAATGDGLAGTTCVVATSGEVSCFGSNARGLLGRDGTTPIVPHPEPVPVSGLHAKSVALAGSFALAEGTDGRLWSWGSNDVLQLARTPRDASADPSAPAWADRITGPVRGVAGTVNNGFAVTEDGAVLSWGDADAQLGRASSLTVDPIPSALALSDITSVAAGASHACVSSRGGAVYCWGDNGRGQLGVGSRGSQLLPRPALLPDGVQAVAVFAGGADTCIIAATGDLHCWGANDTGQVGIAGGADQTVARRIEGLGEQVVSAAIMDETICALRRSGSVMCWGGNAAGELGRGTRDPEIHVEAAPIVIE